MQMHLLDIICCMHSMCQWNGSYYITDAEIRYGPNNLAYVFMVLRGLIFFDICLFCAFRKMCA